MPQLYSVAHINQYHDCSINPLHPDINIHILHTFPLQ